MIICTQQKKKKHMRRWYTRPCGWKSISQRLSEVPVKSLTFEME